MKPLAVLLAIASAFVVAAILVYVVRPEREYVQPRPEDPDGVQPWDPRTTATGLAVERRSA